MWVTKQDSAGTFPRAEGREHAVGDAHADGETVFYIDPDHATVRANADETAIRHAAKTARTSLDFPRRVKAIARVIAETKGVNAGLPVGASELKGDAVILHPLAQLWARVRVERPEVDVFDPTDVADMVGVNADAQRLAADIPHEIQMTEIEVDAEIGIVKKYVFDTR